MRYKKQIISIMTLTILLILMMSTAIQAIGRGEIYDFNATMNGNKMKLTWSSVSNSAGYNIYVNGTKIGSVNTNEASLIGFSENTTYRLQVVAYNLNNVEVAASEEIKFTTTYPKSLEQVKNLTITQINGYVTLNWSSVNNANKYQIFVDVPNFGNVNIGEVTTTNAVLKGFSDGLRYGFSVRACQSLNSNSTRYGEKSVAKYVTIDYNKDDTSNESSNLSRPDRVKNVNAYEVEETTAIVSWSEVSNISGYEVKLSKNYGSYEVVKDTTKKEVYLSNLDADSYYRVKVVAYRYVNGKKVYGDESTYYPFTTKEEKIVVGNINDIKVYDIKEKEATVYWERANNASGYEVMLSKNGGKYQTIYNTTKREVTLSNLDADSYYKVKVIGYKYVNGKKQYGGESPYSEFYTKEEKITVGKVQTIYIDKTTTNGANVSWSSVSNVTGYDIYLAQGSGSFQYLTCTTSRSYAITNLKANTYYRFKVIGYRIVNGKKYSSETPKTKGFITEKEVKITKPGVVNVVRAEVTKGNDVNITWNKVSGATGYEIWISKANGEYEKIAWIAENKATLTSNRLSYNTNYKVKVRAYKNYNVNGTMQTVYGEYSSITSFKTKAYKEAVISSSIKK